MKYLPIRELEDVTTALNFDTADCHVIGGCDLYTTKAAGSDKKLYKEIEDSLESQHETLLKLSVSLSPPQAESLGASLNLSRSSAFGPLSQVSSRRTFAYLIATLNSSHPDYDFSNILRPSDFRRERYFTAVTNRIDSTIYNLRPRPVTVLQGASQSTTGSSAWGPRMWRLIDNEMDLRSCDVYTYLPEEDPFQGEEGAIWSIHHFFFNKQKKRVCYIHLRGMSIIGHTPLRAPIAPTPKKKRRSSVYDDGARKRAVFWLGERAGIDYADDDDDDMVIDNPGDDEVDNDLDLLDHEHALTSSRRKNRSGVRAMSESIMETMELDS
ncbi:mitogen-activated protein kinase MAF1 [Eremomyces bilateralis CBS 781.70]|uniref:Repressor of RNA polymerase III transcription MAF1 n=1 Tax=Eremomyces bilateralis CBS 781.70 TaxID=1392243 RepID=A0A6G1GBH3_9PEZI|nr:mitogen-activated protein kinase MAF1 [Eremomyces bilateralis CBS 781.70]KAF1815251.1 mitogen-activated protein kinase MAF1 [Eremomyces bilateralis CBS 781.70]